MNQTVKNLLLELNKVRRIDTQYLFHTQTGAKLCNTLISRWFRQACKEVGIVDFRFQDLRHTFASWLVQKGVSLYEVQRLLGHKTGQMTQRYAHLAPDNLRTDINSLNDIGTAIKTAIVVDGGSTGTD